MRPMKVTCAVVSNHDLLRPRLDGIAWLLLQLNPLQFKLLDIQIQQRFCAGPEFNVKFNPDRETREEFITNYIDRLSHHINTSRIDNLDTQVKWLKNTLK